LKPGGIFKLSFRNVLRAKRRSAITTLAMAFALGVMIIFLSLMDGFNRSIAEDAVSMQMGSIQVHAPEYFETRSVYKMMSKPDDYIRAINSHGFRAVPRLYSNGLAAKDESSAGVLIEGVDPAAENWAFAMPRQLMDGKWLDRADSKGVVVGKRLANNLSAKIGDEIVIVSQAADGSIANDLFRVRGILKSVNEITDRAGFIMPMATFRDLMVIPEGAHEIAVMIPPGYDLDSAIGIVKKICKGQDIRSWKIMNPALANIINIFQVVMIFLIIITFIAIAIVILNAMLMAVFERIREYGMMKALGVTPYDIFQMVIIEILVQTTAAAAIGMAFGIPLAISLQKYGIDLSILVEGGTISGVAVNMALFSYLSAFDIAMPLAALFVFSLSAGIIPAVRAARLDPVRAIHYT
jgi:ABC-type lipoprotein release transport system permease subunit